MGSSIKTTMRQLLAIMTVSLLLLLLAANTQVYGQTVASVQAAVNAVTAQAAATTANMATLQRLLRTTINTAGDAVVVVDATLTASTKCGPQTITGWTENLDDYVASGTNTLHATSRSFTPATGVFTPPINGWYRVCAFFRFKNSGNANDVTIMKGTAVVAAFGSGITEDWLSTGTCINMDITTTDQITVKHQSGGSSDCIQETGWFYARFIAHLISCKTAACG